MRKSARNGEKQNPQRVSTQALGAMKLDSVDRGKSTADSALKIFLMDPTLDKSMVHTSLPAVAEE